MESNFGAVINALVGSALANARNLYHKLVGSAVRQIPFVGDRLGSAWDNYIEVAYRVNRGWIEAAIGALVGVVRRPTDVANTLINALSGHITSTLVMLWKLRYVYIPQAEARAESYAGQLFTWLDQETRRLIADAIAYAQQLYGQAIGYADLLYGRALDFARQLHQQALDYASQLHQQETAYAQQLYDQGIAYARALNEQETAFARAGILQAEDYARSLQEQALGFTRDVEGFARAGILQAEDYARALFQDLAQEQIKGERRSEDYTQTLVKAIYALPCIQQCEPLGALGKDLSGLDLTELLLAVLRAAKDPVRGREDLLGRFLGPAQTLTADVRQLLARI